MAKAKTIKMVTGNVTIDYIQFKRDKSNITDVFKFGNSKVFKEIINSNQKLHLDNGQRHPATKEKLTVEIKPGDILAKYPDGLHVFCEADFFESHIELG